MNLIDGITKGDHRAIAKAISLVENNIDRAKDILREIYPFTGKSTIIGITGAPGSGKSTLINELISVIKKDKNRIGIIAVDPSSPFSGGAILGDRIRMMAHSQDPDVFIRSMATRGYLGGLSRATGDAIAVLEAAGKDIVLVETVGVGQDEVDVIKLADIVVVVITPGSGDDIQIFKAGIMEIADVFVINKADFPDTERMEKNLMAMLELGSNTERSIPVVKTIATQKEGIPQLQAAINNIICQQDPGAKEQKKKKQIYRMVEDIIKERVLHMALVKTDPAKFEEMIDKIYQRSLDPYAAAEEIITKILRK
jgi:LAO/AO transport system kinase